MIATSRRARTGHSALALVLCALALSACGDRPDSDGANPVMGGGATGGTMMTTGGVGGAAGVGGESGGASGVGAIGGAGGAAGMMMAGGVGGEAGVGGAGGEAGIGGEGGTGGVGMPGPGAPAADCGDANCWPYMGYDLGSTFHNARETTLTIDNVASLEPLWTKELIGSATGTAAVAGDTVYFMSNTMTYAFDRMTGAERWSSDDAGGSGSVTWAADKLYVQRSTGDLLMFDTIAGPGPYGEPVWKAKVAGTASIGTPLVVGNKLLVGASSGDEVAFGTSSFRGNVVAIDVETGAEIWRHYTVEAPSNGAAVWSSPSADVELGLGFFTSGNNYNGPSGGQSDSIFALELDTGETAWTFQALAGDVWSAFSSSNTGPDHDFGTNPIVFEGGGKKLVGAGAKSGTFYALDRTTGELVWMRTVAQAGCAYGGILNNGATDGERVFVSSWPCSGSAKLMVLDPSNGDIVWEISTPEQTWAPITVANGVLFVPSQKTMNAYNAATGDLLFSYDTAGSICSGAVVVDGQVFFGSGFPPSHIGNVGGATDGKVLHALALP